MDPRAGNETWKLFQPRSRQLQVVNLIGEEHRVLTRSGGVVTEPPLGRFAGQRRYLQPAYRFGKRVVDVVVSLVALVLLLPLFVLAAATIILADGFPIFFTQDRVGRFGKPFKIFKFRTMVKDAEGVLKRNEKLMAAYKESYKIDRDPRILKAGNFFRKSSIDELPQLVNVLLGEMSLVGPRPIVEPELERYGDGQEVYLLMKPGCAGLWQCQGRSNTSYEERVAYDTEYFDRASIRFDLSILLRTFATILRGKGAR